MAATLLFPFLNPIRFIDNNNTNDGFYLEKLPFFEAKLFYCQKFQQDNILRFQFACLNTASSITVQLVKLVNGIETIETTLTANAFTLSYYTTHTQYYVSKSLSTIPEGIYWIKVIVVKADATQVVAYSEPIDVAVLHDNTLLLTYTHDENDFDMIFVDTESARSIEFEYRVEGGFKSTDFAPAAKDTVYQDQPYNTTLINSVPFDTLKVTFGNGKGIPNYAAKIINRIFSCNDVKIDNKAYTKVEGAKMEATQTEDVPLRGWKLEIIDPGNEMSFGVDTDVAVGIGHMIIEDTFIIG